MSQIIACKTEDGIVLASDSQALEMNLQGHLTEHQINRIFQLTSHTAIITGGSIEGTKMCESLKDFVGQEQLKDIEDVYNAALPYLASEYERFMRKTCEFLPIDPINQVHFILAGYSSRNQRKPFQLYLLWTKKKLPQIDGDEISTAYSVPRLMTLEFQLNQRCKKNEPLNQLIPLIQECFDRQSRALDEIAGPFSFACITRDGFDALSI